MSAMNGLNTLYSVGVSHRTAVIADRERLAAVFGAFGGASGVQEWIAVCTCNRAELYFIAESPETLLEAIPDQAVTVLHAESAAHHLLRVAAGLESQVIGEPHILGQVKVAYQTAHAAGTSGPILARLFQTALRAGKRARQDAHPAGNGVSVASGAVQHARTQLGDLKTRTALIIGAGSVARSAARALYLADIGRLIIANRTLEHADSLAASYGGESAPLDALPSLIAQADLIIGAATAPGYLVSILECGAGRKHFYDLALPRVIDPAIGAIPGATLFNLDDLSVATETTVIGSLHIESILCEELIGFLSWLQLRPAAVAIQTLADQPMDSKATRHAQIMALKRAALASADTP